MALVGLIPAAGKGSRLGPLPFSKELYPIGYEVPRGAASKAKRPKVVSQYLVDHMVAAGTEKIIITIAPNKWDIMHYFGSGVENGIDIAYNFQREPKGMPYALDLSFHWLTPEDMVIFGMSDTIIQPENIFSKILATHKSNHADLTLGLFHTQNPEKFGMVDFDTKTKLVHKTIDKPKQTELTHMWGNCVWNYKFAQFMHDYLKQPQTDSIGKELVFGDIINAAIQAGMKVTGEPIQNGLYIDIGTIEDLDSALKNFHL